MNDLKPGTYFVFEGDPYEVLTSQHVKMQQRRPVMQTRIKNLKTGKVLDRNFQSSDNFEEAELAKKEVRFLYSRRGEYWFAEKSDPRKRFFLPEEFLDDSRIFIKENSLVTALEFNAKIISLEIPVKVDLKVTQAPPAVKGNTATGGTKQVTLETGAEINVPLFVDVGDVIRVNTRTKEYNERVQA